MRTALTRRSRPTTLLGAIALLMVATLAVVAHPQPAGAAPSSTDFTVGADSGQLRAWNDVASTGTKSLVVYSKHSVNDRDHVWAVLMNAGGGSVSNPIRIDRRATDAIEPHVAWNGTYFLVVWSHDFSDDGVDRDIRGQLVTDNGALLGNEIPIETGTSLAHWPAVAAGPNGTFEVVWHERAISDRTADLNARSYSTSSGLGSKTTLRNNTVGFTATELVWVSGAQRFVVAYPEGGGRDFAVFTAAGAVQGMGEISDGYYNPFSLWDGPTALATDGTRVLAVFPSLEGGINGMWIDLQPIRHSEPFALPANSVSGGPDVAFNGIFLVIWTEETQTSPQTEKWALKGARVKPDGTVMDTTPLAISSIPDLELVPALSRGVPVQGSTTSFTLAWQNGHFSDDGLDPYFYGIVFTAGVKTSTK